MSPAPLRCSGRLAVVVISLCLAGAGSPGPKRDAGPRAEPRVRLIRAYEIGLGVRSCWVFEPSQPAPAKAPVVVFCHGWLSTNPGLYGAWIEHLVGDGRI